MMMKQCGFSMYSLQKENTIIDSFDHNWTKLGSGYRSKLLALNMD
jgi:hypothetical protein